MILRDVKRIDRASVYGVWSAAAGSGGNFSGSFQQNMSGQLKEHFRGRAAALFEEINEMASTSFQRMDIVNFERYRRLIGELVSDVVNNAFVVSRECVLDYAGRQRIYSTVGVIDDKLAGLAADLLQQHVDRIEFLSSMDEIRGLVMDMLL